MRLTRALAVALASVLMAAGTLVGLAGPATAATKNTVVTFENPSANTGYGDYYSIYAKVRTTDGEDVYRGSLTVYSRPVGGTAWTPLFSNDSAYVIKGFELEESFEYYAAYSGGSDSTDTYTPSQSAPVTVNVHRGVKYIQKSARKFCGQVGPLSAPYKNKPIHHFYKVGKSKKWKKGYTVRTNKKSQYCYKVKKSGKPPKKLKTPKGPKLKASKTVYVKSGGMKKYVDIYNYTS